LIVNMSDTPRTDAVLKQAKYPPSVTAPLCRELERKLAEAERFMRSMRCPNCDNLRLEMGALIRDSRRLEFVMANAVTLDKMRDGHIDGIAVFRAVSPRHTTSSKWFADWRDAIDELME
jgi:hypothetical protein